MFDNANNKDDLITEVLLHYTMWTDDISIRKSRKNGWDDILKAYWGELPDDWAFDSKVIDPILRTSINEKTARLMNSKLKGRVAPRETGDNLKARIHNTIIDFQWDTAEDKGSMMSKWAIMDQETRLFGSKFALCPWVHDVDKDGKVTFDGNEFYPLNAMDAGIDPACDNIKDANWFQARTFETVESLVKKYPIVKELVKGSGNRVAQDRRDTNYTDIIKALKGLTDRKGEDRVFPVYEVVTEYRKDKFITFLPQHQLLLKEIKNPYKHGKIPVVQLRYYPLTSDPMGESEAESVLPLWYSIQAVLNGFLDTMIITARPPLKTLQSAVRMETLKLAPDEVWVMDRIDAVMPYQVGSEALNYFQTTYTALKSAFSQAMGDLSQGISNLNPLTQDKTATEVRATVRQQNVRDQSNQNYLTEAIEDMVNMWISNNQQFLFTEDDKKPYILRILGRENFAYFKESGLDAMELTDEASNEIAGLLQDSNGNYDDLDLQALIEAGKTPKFPIQTNPGAKEGEEMYKTKMEVSNREDEALLSIVPEDLEGEFDFKADVRSMALSAGEEALQSRQRALALMTGNPTILQLLNQDGYRPNVKELLSTIFEYEGSRDPDRFFVKLENTPPAVGGTPTNPAIGGLPEAPATSPETGTPEQMAQPSGLQVPGGVLPSIPESMG